MSRKHFPTSMCQCGHQLSTGGRDAPNIDTSCMVKSNISGWGAPCRTENWIFEPIQKNNKDHAQIVIFETPLRDRTSTRGLSPIYAAVTVNYLNRDFQKFAVLSNLADFLQKHITNNKQLTCITNMYSEKPEGPSSQERVTLQVFKNSIGFKPSDRNSTRGITHRSWKQTAFHWKFLSSKSISRRSWVRAQDWQQHETRQSPMLLPRIPYRPRISSRVPIWITHMSNQDFFVHTNQIILWTYLHDPSETTV